MKLIQSGRINKNTNKYTLSESFTTKLATTTIVLAVDFELTPSVGRIRSQNLLCNIHKLWNLAKFNELNSQYLPI